MSLPLSSCSSGFRCSELRRKGMRGKRIAKCVGRSVNHQVCKQASGQAASHFLPRLSNARAKILHGYLHLLSIKFAAMAPPLHPVARRQSFYLSSDAGVPRIIMTPPILFHEKPLYLPHHKPEPQPKRTRKSPRNNAYVNVLFS